MKKITISFAISFLVFTGSLIAQSKVDRCTSTLKIQVYDNLGKIADSCRVRVYTSKEDYEKEQNHVAEVYTKKNGICQVTGLCGKAYYINAVKGDKTNAGNGELTEVLEVDKLNKMKLIISE